MATCRGCGAKIVWVKSRAGKNIPCDPEWYSADDCEPGDVLVTEDGDVIRITGVYAAHGENCRAIEGYVSHFSTCPKADEFRTNSKT